MLFFTQPKTIIWLIFILLLANISARCNETQVNINSASAEELDKLINVGPTIAARIIETRPFGSVNDLIRVKGIGNITLNEIKQQGLACVEEETENNSSAEEADNSKISSEEVEENETTKKVENISNEEENYNTPAKELSLISLNSVNSKSIKSEENTEFLGKNLALFGVIAFCVIFGALFLVKKRKYKNEFN